MDTVWRAASLPGGLGNCRIRTTPRASLSGATSAKCDRTVRFGARDVRKIEDGNRIRDADGKFVFNAVPTTDWGSPETLEYWRQTWAELCNGKFAEKGLDVRIDHRSYERQGVELLPTVHEGATVRAMEKKGIRTEKGEFNRWIRATNAVIRDIKKKIALLFDWIAVLDGAS